LERSGFISGVYVQTEFRLRLEDAGFENSALVVEGANSPPGSGRIGEVTE
jgi:hypothetical protein